MNSYKYFLMGIFISVMLVACQDEVAVNIPQNQKLVVLSNFTTDSLFKASVSVSAPLNNYNFEYPDDLEFQFYKDDIFIENLSFKASDDPFFIAPYYFSNTPIEEGVEYSIRINHPSYPSIYSKNSIPSAVDISSFDLIGRSMVLDSSGVGVEHYIIRSRVQFPVHDDQPYFHLLAWQQLIYYDVINGDTIQDHIGFEPLYITAATSFSYTRLYDDQGILINQNDLRQSVTKLILEFDLYRYPDFEFKSPIYITLRHVSKDYYLFHKSLAEQGDTDNNQSLLYTSPAFIHNNIEGGIGNFSAYNTSIDSLFW